MGSPKIECSDMEMLRNGTKLTTWQKSAKNVGGEVIELKFDLGLPSDEERLVFANTQRQKLAMLLGIPESLVQVLSVKPGSPVTLVRFQINAEDAARIPTFPREDESGINRATGPSQPVPPLGISMLKSGGSSGHHQLSSRLREIYGDQVPLEDRTNASAGNGAENVFDGSKAYRREDANEMRKQTDLRTKGNSTDTIPGSQREDEPHQHLAASGEFRSTPTFIFKDKGSTSGVDSDIVERIFKPGRDIMQDDQYSSAKVQRRPPRPPKRLTDIPVTLENDLDEQVKVPYEEVDNTRRLKEQEDELNFLPAQRAALASRTAIMAKKDEGLEDSKFDFLREHDHKKEEKQKESASFQPSLKLTKALEEIQYELAQKVTGYEDPRTVVPCEPSGLSLGDKRSKRKGKNGEKLSAAAVPEAYMAFGIDKESQRLAPSIVTLEKPSDKDKGISVKLPPEILDGIAPTIIQMKFDAAFVDQESRNNFAEAQRIKMAKLLRVPIGSISVRMVAPGSPITVVTFEIEQLSAEASSDGVEPVFSSRPFDSPVLEVEVMSSLDNEAETLMNRLRGVLGPKVRIVRQSASQSKSKSVMKEKNVKFDEVSDANLQPAYLKSRAELQAKALLRQKGALTSDKEAVEVNVDRESGVAEKRNDESGMEERMPIVSFDRRLPKNAKNKQHLLSRIHTIESTLQRLYGKLEVDSELPDIESIEQIMSSTIKQAVYTQEADVHKEKPTQRDDGRDVSTVPEQKSDSMVTESFDDGDGIGDGMDPGDDAERRAQLRAERRKRMEERERIRSEKQSLDGKPKSTSTVRFDVAAETASGKSQPLNSNEATMQRLKDVQDEDKLALYPSNIPSVAVHAGIDDEFGDVSKKKMDALKTVASTTESQVAKDRGLNTSRSDKNDEPMDAYELQQMAASGTDGWKAAFSKVRHGKKADLLAMLDAGCPCDLKDEAGNTLLNIAAQNGHKSVIKALLRRGASINTQNHKGQTPLHFCFTYGFADLGNYLISKGADDTVQNVAGLTCYDGLGD